MVTKRPSGTVPPADQPRTAPVKEIRLRSLLAYAWPYRAKLTICAALSFNETAAVLALPWLGGQFASGVLTSAPADIDLILLALLALFAMQAALKFITRVLLNDVSIRILTSLRIRIYDHVQALPLAYLQARPHGDLLALMTHEIAQLSAFTSSMLVSMPTRLLTVLGAVVLMIRIDPELGLIVTVLLPIFVLIVKVLGRRLRPIAADLQKSHAAATSIAGENLSMMPAIKMFAREDWASERYRRQVWDVLRLSGAQLRINAALEPVIQFLAAAAIVLLLWLSGNRIDGGQLTTAELISFLLYAALLTRPMSSLAGVYGQVQLAKGALARLLEVFDELPEESFASGKALPPVRGEISIESVRFAYPGRQSVLRGLNLHVTAGETLAITGKNGAGKSTLAHLLLRLHEPDAGRIRIDGVEIVSVELRSLRRQIGIVPQNVLLLNGSIRDNIAFGQPDADDAAIEAAARMAEAHEFIQHLPQGYDTQIGDQGVHLSGGQRQRLALARALLRDPPILILDEATAMFDPEGERAFNEAFRRISVGRTVLLITHREAALALADRVVRLENGEICEVGTVPSSASPAASNEVT